MQHAARGRDAPTGSGGLSVVIEQTAADIAREDVCAADLAAAWRWTIHRFPPLTPVDYYAERGRSMVAVIEIKTHPHASDAYPCCYIDVHKLMNLDLAELGLSVPALLVKGFTDRTLWIRVAEIDRTSACVMGRQDRGRDERHPALAIPIRQMKSL